MTLVEGVPGHLSEMILDGRLDMAIMAQPEAFSDRLEICPLYRESFCIAFPTGHRFQEKNAVRVADVTGETYLLRTNCEDRDYIRERCAEHGFAVRTGFRSEREDWIQMMVVAGFGICFLPEYSSTVPGLQTRRVVEPEIVREVSLVSIAGRRFSPVVASFSRAARSYAWSEPNRLAL